MQIQLRRRRRENTSHPPEKSQVCHLSHVSLSPLIHPSIHPSLPVSTAFASYSHIKPLSWLLCALSLSLSSAGPVSRYLVFLSTLLIPHLHPKQARGFQRGGDGRRDRLRRRCVSTQIRCVLFELRRRGEKKEKNNTKRIQEWGLEKCSGGGGGWQVRQVER